MDKNKIYSLIMQSIVPTLPFDAYSITRPEFYSNMCVLTDRTGLLDLATQIVILMSYVGFESLTNKPLWESKVGWSNIHQIFLEWKSSVCYSLWERVQVFRSRGTVLQKQIFEIQMPTPTIIEKCKQKFPENQQW